MVRYIGERVRYYRSGTGWMFGTVRYVRVVAGLELATVYFPPYASWWGYGSHASETVEVLASLLEGCG
jgi:hypothetical protein